MNDVTLLFGDSRCVMRRFMTTVLASALLTGCGGGDAFSPESVSGHYVLQSVNGNSLPFSETAQDGVTVTFSIIVGSINLNENGTFLVSLTVGVGTTVIGTETEFGTFELVEPANLRFTASADGDVFSGTLDGRRLTILMDDDDFVFSKATNLRNISRFRSEQRR